MLSDEIKEQYKKLKGQGIKAHLAWFWEYYKIEAAIAVISIGVVVGIIQTIVSHRPTAFNVMFLNAAVTDDYLSEALAEDYAQYAGINLKEYDVVFDLRETLSMEGDSQYDMGTVQKIAAQSAARELDAMVCNAFHFYNYVYNGIFTDLRDAMTEQELAQYEGKIFYVDGKDLKAFNEAVEKMDYSLMPETLITDPEEWQSKESFVLPDPGEMEDPIPFGIAVGDSRLITEYSFYPRSASFFGIAASSERMPAATAFLHYLYQ